MKTKLPQGVQDYIGAEYFNKKRIEDQISSVFSVYGYEQIQTAALEYMENFSGAHGGLVETRMFKMTDCDGRLVALRPDATLQVSRIVADKFADSDLNRFFYVTDTFVQDSKDYNRELAQVGAELIGNDSVDSDVEIVELAVKTCLAVGLKDFQIEIGNINFFYGMLDGLGISDEDKETLRSLINKKDLIGAMVYLRERGVSETQIERLNRLPYLFGGTEVLDQALHIADGKTCKEAIDRLKTITDKLTLRGLDKYVSIDLGMVKTNNYYSGLVLRGISRSLGHAIMDGGRYDNLCKNYGLTKPAVGLSVWMKRLLMALEKQGDFLPQPSADACVLDLGDEIAACDLCERLRADAKKVVRYYGSEKDAVAYCKARNIGVLYVFDRKGSKEVQL